MQPRRRPGETPQKFGRRFERLWASIFGIEPQKGSGNTWLAKMDVADGSITWSCRATTHRSYSISKEDIREIDRGIRQNGDESIPGMAIALDDGSEILVVLKADDFMRLLGTEQSRYIVPSKGEQKRLLARIPGLLRDTEQSP